MKQGYTLTAYYKTDWKQSSAAETYAKKSKAFTYDNFILINNTNQTTVGTYQPTYTIYNIRRKDAPETENP